MKVIPREAVPDIYALKHEVDILRRLNHYQVMRSVDDLLEYQAFFELLKPNVCINRKWPALW